MCGNLRTGQSSFSAAQQCIICFVGLKRRRRSVAVGYFTLVRLATIDKPTINRKREENCAWGRWIRINQIKCVNSEGIVVMKLMTDYCGEQTATGGWTPTVEWDEEEGEDELLNFKSHCTPTTNRWFQWSNIYCSVIIISICLPGIGSTADKTRNRRSNTVIRQCSLRIGSHTRDQIGFDQETRS